MSQVKRTQKSNTNIPDLKAENAALKRQLEIEAALERVRARTMAMQHSDELAEVATVLFQQVKALGVPQWACGFSIFEIDDKDFAWYPGGPDGEILAPCKIPLTEHPVFISFNESKKRGDELFVYEKEGEFQADHYRYMLSLPVVGDFLQSRLEAGFQFPTFQIDHIANFSHGNLIFITYEHFPEMHQIFKRFAKVFEQTYKRFLDLKKAEEQAREAQIEVALERVRARAMAMHSSDEILQVADVLREEMGLLGQPELAVSAVHIYIKGAKTFDSWWAFVPTGKRKRKILTGISNIRINTAVAKEFIEKYESKQNEYTIYASGKRLRDWQNEVAIVAPKQIKSYQQQLPKEQYFHFSDFTGGSLVMVSYKEPAKESKDLQKRAASVFDMAYRRFLDLKKAEEQARESEIELALERIRARTMAMQHSDELADASLLLAQQIKALGIETWGCAFHIYDEDSNTATEWFSNDKEALPTYNLKKENIFLEYYQQGQKGDALYIKTFGGKACQKHYRYLCTLPGVGDALLDMKAKGVPFPSFQIDHVAYFKYGHLLFITFEPVPEAHSIFTRMASVFEQTYTRFLDLKKAEEQAREAQIEVALERVRARTMAMHKGEELADTALLLFDQITELGIKPRGCGFLIMDKETKSMLDWSANINEKGKASLVTGTLSFDQHPILSGVVDTWEKGKPYFIGEVHGKALQKYYQSVTAKESTSKTIQDKVLSKYQSEWTNSFYFEYGMMYALTPYTISQEEINILLRFANVFKLTYRRFLDLKKAEEQAREAQIEAALERIRNRTLLMHDSGELNEAVAVFFQEFQKMDLLPAGARTYFCDIDADTDTAEVWMTHADGTVMKGSHQTPLTRSASMSQFYEGWKLKEPIVVRNYSGKALKDYLRFVSSLPHVKKDKDYQKLFRSPPKRIVMTDANFLQGNIGIMTFEPLGQEAKDTLIRFAKVFEFTYTRFLDLQKAEEQAREAQIEASLERVRAKAMAMHSSEDLTKTVGQLFLELDLLDVNILRCGVGRVHKDTRVCDLYTFSSVKKGEPVPVVGKLILSGHPLLEGYFQHWEKQKDYHHVLKGASLKKYYQSINTDYKLPGKQDSPVHYGYFFSFSAGVLFAFSESRFTDDELSIFRKFSSVVGLTYRRYLDLMEAEAQAREAQIEASLERVRAKAMAMHSSEDLTKTVGQLFLELDLLDVNILRCGVGRIHKDTRLVDLFTFTSSKKGEPVPVLGTAILKGHPALEGCFRGWLKQEEHHAVLKGASLKQYYQLIKTDFKLPVNQSSQVQYGYYLPFSAGCLYTFSETPFTEEELAIFRKFTSVVGLTYRRYLDLMEAEAQAREAQIEASLERVRAAAMAMHDSQDIGVTTSVMFKELRSLGVETLRTGVSILDNEERSIEIWMSKESEQNDIIQVMGKIPAKTNQILNSYFNSWQKGEKVRLAQLSGTKLKRYYESLAQHYYFPEKRSRSKKEYMGTFFFSDGGINIVRDEPLSNEVISILQRFAGVFDLTYRRFLDLKKAEEQAQEAQIEAALERVRASAMAMHSSDDLFTVANVLHDQLSELGQEELESTIIHIYPDHLPTFDTWYSFQPIGGRKHMDELQVPKNACSWTKEVMKKYRAKEQAYVIESRGKMLLEWYQLLEDICPAVIDHDDKGKLIVPEVLYYHFSKFSGGALLMISNEPPAEEARELQQRAAKVFDLAYRRFLDLQTAEAQAREAQIEAALERVRAASLAMHKTDELGQVAEVLFQQFSELELEFYQVWINIFLLEEGYSNCWFSPVEGVIKEPYTAVVPLGPFEESSIKSWRAGKEFSYLSWKGRKEVDRIMKELSKLTGHPSFAKIQQKKKMDRVEIVDSNHKYGVLAMAKNDEITDEDHSILRRFTKIFEQAYTRFLDLQKAEAQAREAQIEAALERVRASAMAMHSSDDIFSVAEVLHDQLAQLGQLELESSIIHIYPKHLTSMDVWYSYRSTIGKQVMDRTQVVRNSCSWAQRVMELYESDETSYLIESRGKMLRDWYQVLAAGVAPEVIEYDRSGKIIVPKVLYYYFSKFSGGALLMISEEPPAVEAKDMQQRAAVVFDLAYRRFLDLKKAESQAREAQIETGLERVRSSTMAMHSSEDVGTATMVLFQELENLGIETLRCGVSIIKENRTMEVWAASTSSGGEVFTVPGIVDMSFHPMVNQLFEYWKSGKEVFTYELKGKDAQRYYKTLKNMPEYNVPMGKNLPDRHISNGFLFRHGALFAFTKDYLTKEASEIFQKFTNVFTLTYGRYLDLKQAEAREKEAVKQSSLDRVRAEIASMRNKEDLQRITPLVWRELGSLGVPFFRCGVFIIDEKTETVHMYLSTPEGNPLAALHLEFDEQEIPLVEDAITHWKTQTVHIAHWDQQQFRIFTQSLKDRGLIKSLKTYQRGEKPPKSLNLHQVPFKQGMLYVGSSELLTDEQIELVQALAEAFSVAYSRYEDFVQLEEAKANVENTLAELKSTQDQLIHSEKMASLGELTAGIAHEIQNPLNFVNNFSEVSSELIDELQEEMAAGNLQDALEIGQDLIQNIEKIHHHGQRASSIVRGMLQHSRASSDEKQLTDINELADEYLRLAYHGFRAKDKSFNASYQADLAEDLPKIEVVPQDIGRVLLNLVNNAFQAVRAVESPEVTVKTRLKEDVVEISVIDNGPGIPEEIKEKIFQPFFTTKAAGEGTGLGLSLSYDIVTKGHGGEIEVKSNKGDGTEFIISLPMGSTP